jgi:RNA polymerase sigma factor (sigma-70 family)
MKAQAVQPATNSSSTVSMSSRGLAKPDGESLSQMLDRWRAGEQAAAFSIYERYYARVVNLAKLEIGPVLQGVLTPESVALSVLESLLKGIAKHGYEPGPSGSLSTPIRKITKNKIRKAWEYWTAMLRDIRRRTNADPLPEPTSSGQLPENAVILADELSRIRELLPSDDFEILTLRLEGLENPEIADRLGVTRQTVLRKVKRLEDFLRRRAQSGNAS